MSEKWKEIQGSRETYLISNRGNVRTKTRIGTRGNIVRGRELTQNKNSSGYSRVSIRLPQDTRSKDRFVHRLVAELFIPKQDNKSFVNHIDGNKQNNTVENLEWCDRSYNERHAWATGLKTDVATKGELHGMHKLHTEDVLYIRENHKRNGGKYSTGELARVFSVNPQTITDIVSRRIWRHV